MAGRAQNLAQSLQDFTDQVIDFVKGCSDKDWIKVCKPEDWTVGVTARHIGAGHFQAVGLARMIASGTKLPELTMAQLTDMANEHARLHHGCTQAEVLEVLRQNAADLVGYVSGLSDAELDRSGHLALLGGKVSTQRFLEAVILSSGGEHLASMKATVGA